MRLVVKIPKQFRVLVRDNNGGYMESRQYRVVISGDDVGCYEVISIRYDTFDFLTYFLVYRNGYFQWVNSDQCTLKP